MTSTESVIERNNDRILFSEATSAASVCLKVLMSWNIISQPPVFTDVV